METNATAAERRMIMATEFNTQVSNGEYRLQFKTNNKEHYLLMQSAARRCIDRAHMTNADCIRSMNDEELAELLCNFRSCDADEYICEGCKATQYCRAGHAGTIDWLQQPAEEIER